MNGAIVTYTTKEGQAHEFDGFEFLALLSSHIAKPYESLTRYYGWYSCRARGERRKRAPEEKEKGEGVLSPGRGAKCGLAGAACMKRIYEIDPLECAKCKGQMRVVAFTRDTKEISKIMQALDISPCAMPAPLPRAPPDVELISSSDSNLF